MRTLTRMLMRKTKTTHMWLASTPSFSSSHPHSTQHTHLQVNNKSKVKHVTPQHNILLTIRPPTYIHKLRRYTAAQSRKKPVSASAPPIPRKSPESRRPSIYKVTCTTTQSPWYKDHYSSTSSPARPPSRCAPDISRSTKRRYFQDSGRALRQDMEKLCRLVALDEVAIYAA